MIFTILCAGGRVMMGCRTGSQDRLFYSFNLDEHIPQNHLLRGIERCLDLGELRQHLADYYSHTGRPSIDPELMIRMLIVGYCYGIRSERRLCEEVHLNLAYRWFCRLGLEDAVPDACLNTRAAATMFCSAASVSAQPRVFRPQSGLTQRLRGGMTCAAFSSSRVMSSADGTRGLWMS